MRHIEDGRNYGGLKAIIKNKYNEIHEKIKDGTMNQPSLEAAYNKAIYETETLDNGQENIIEVRGEDGKFARIEEYIVLDADKDDKKELIELVGGKGAEGVVAEREREQRRKLRDELSHKLYNAELKGHLSRAPYEGGVDRTVLSLLNQDISPRARTENDRFVKIMTEGTEKAKREELSRKLEEIGELDISFVDLTDDAAFVKNYEKYRKIRDWGDAQNIIELAENNKIDLTQPRFANFCKKIWTFYDIAMVLKEKEDIITSPIYDVVDLERLSPDVGTEIKKSGFGESVALATTGQFTLKSDLPSIKLLTDKSKSPKERIELLQDSFLSSEGVYQNSWKTTNVLSKAGKYKKIDSTAEKDPEKLFKGIEDGTYQPLSDTPDGYFAGLIDNARTAIGKCGVDQRGNISGQYLSLIAVQQMQVEYTKLVSEGKAPSREDFYRKYNPDKVEERAAALKDDQAVNTVLSKVTENQYGKIVCGDRKTIAKLENSIQKAIEEEAKAGKDLKEYYRTIIENNIKRLQTIDTNFKMEPEEIEAMLSDDRIAMHQRAIKLKNDLKKLAVDFTEMTGTTMQGSLSRSIHVLGKLPDEKGAEEYNRELFKELTGTTAENAEKRKELFAEVLNKSNELSPDPILSWLTLSKKPEETELQFAERRAEEEKKIFDIASKNYQNAVFAWDDERCVMGFGEAGLNLTEEAAKKHSDQKEYLVSLGSAYKAFIDRYADDELFAFPFQKLTSLQLISFGPQLKWNELAAAATKDMLAINAFKGKPRASGLTYSAKDFESPVPEDERSVAGCAELRSVYAKFYRELKDADSIFNFNNSEYYKNLLKDLEDADAFLADLAEYNGAVPDVKKQELRDVIRKIDASAGTYKKIKGKDATGNRAKRVQICGRIGRFNSLIISGSKEKNPGDIYELDGRFLNFLDLINSKAAEEKKPNEVIQERQRKYEQSVKKYEEELGIKFIPGTDAREAHEKALAARDELLNIVGRKSLNEEKARDLIARVLCFDMISGGNFERSGMKPEEFEAAVGSIKESAEFTEAFREINDDKLLDFMTGASQPDLSEKLLSSLGNNEKEKILGPETETQAVLENLSKIQAEESEEELDKELENLLASRVEKSEKEPEANSPAEENKPETEKPVQEDKKIDAPKETVSKVTEGKTAEKEEQPVEQLGSEAGIQIPENKKIENPGEAIPQVMEEKSEEKEELSQELLEKIKKVEEFAEKEAGKSYPLGSMKSYSHAKAVEARAELLQIIKGDKTAGPEETRKLLDTVIYGYHRANKNEQDPAPADRTLFEKRVNALTQIPLMDYLTGDLSKDRLAELLNEEGTKQLFENYGMLGEVSYYKTDFATALTSNEELRNTLDSEGEQLLPVTRMLKEKLLKAREVLFKDAFRYSADAETLLTNMATVICCNELLDMSLQNAKNITEDFVNERIKDIHDDEILNAKIYKMNKHDVLDFLNSNHMDYYYGDPFSKLGRCMNNIENESYGIDHGIRKREFLSDAWVAADKAVKAKGALLIMARHDNIEPTEARRYMAEALYCSDILSGGGLGNKQTEDWGKWIDGQVKTISNSSIFKECTKTVDKNMILDFLEVNGMDKFMKKLQEAVDPEEQREFMENQKKQVKENTETETKETEKIVGEKSKQSGSLGFNI